MSKTITAKYRAIVSITKGTLRGGVKQVSGKFADREAAEDWISAMTDGYPATAGINSFIEVIKPLGKRSKNPVKKRKTIKKKRRAPTPEIHIDIGSHNVNPKRSRNPVKRDADQVAVTELINYAYNERSIYNQFLSIIENLKKKIASGKYNQSLAPKLWRYWIDNAAKAYTKDFGTPGAQIFSVADRDEASRQVAKIEHDNLMDNVYGEFERKGRKKNPLVEKIHTQLTDSSRDNPTVGYEGYAVQHSYKKTNPQWLTDATFGSPQDAKDYAKHYAARFPKDYVRVVRFHPK